MYRCNLCRKTLAVGAIACLICGAPLRPEHHSVSTIQPAHVQNVGSHHDDDEPPQSWALSSAAGGPAAVESGSALPAMDWNTPLSEPKRARRSVEALMAAGPISELWRSLSASEPAISSSSVA
jgi:hypothetical protein